MFNVAIIKKTYVTAIVCMTLVLSSCGGANNKDTEAEGMFANAKAQFDKADYKQALVDLDSLKSKFPSAIETQKKALHLRTLIEEKTTIDEIKANDSLIEATTAQKQLLEKDFTFIKTKDMVEGYHVLKSASKRPLVQRTGIEARIDEQGNIYLITLLHGNPVKHTRISVSSSKGEEIYSNEVPYNGSTNYRFVNEGVSDEMITFRSEQCDTLNQFIAANKDSNLKLNFIGKKRFSMPLSAADKKMIVDTYNYSNAIINGKKAESQKLYLDKKLEIAREQVKKTEPRQN